MGLQQQWKVVLELDLPRTVAEQSSSYYIDGRWTPLVRQIFQSDIIVMPDLCMLRTMKLARLNFANRNISIVGIPVFIPKVPI